MTDDLPDRREAAENAHSIACYEVRIPEWDYYTKDDTEDQLGMSWTDMADLYPNDAANVSKVMRAVEALRDADYIATLENIDGRMTIRVKVTLNALEGMQSDLSDKEQEVLEEIREGDVEATNGGYFISDETDRLVAEGLVDKGMVVRFTNPAGVTPKYAPVDSDRWSDDRLERMNERQERRV
jgi:hypothetical protein